MKIVNFILSCVIYTLVTCKLLPFNKIFMRNILFLSLLIASFLPIYGQNTSARLDSLLQANFKPGEPGAAIAIQAGGTILFQNAYGLADLVTKEKNSIHTNFNIGSITKQFTAFSILQLAEKNKLSLSDNLLKYFPEFNKNTGSTISVRQLLTHSSGLTDHYALADTHLLKHASNKTALLAVSNSGTTYFMPGFGFRYSNTAYCLLGLVIEKLSGLSYADYIKQNIFRPLSMDHSQVFEPGAAISNRAYGYESTPSGFQKLDADESVFFSTEADGGIYTSVTEYLKWFNGLQQATLMPKEWVEKARSAQFPADSQHQLSYGYGWFVHEKGTEKIVYHTGSNGGFRAMIFSIPSRNYVVVVFSNRTGVDLEKLVREINHIIGTTDNSYADIDSLES
jgi:D-alanyl-D-alanine carboxypeptidase